MRDLPLQVKISTVNKPQQKSTKVSISDEEGAVDISCGGKTPSVLLLKAFLSPKLSVLPPQAVYRLTKFESELLAQASSEQMELGRQMIKDGLLSKKKPN